MADVFLASCGIFEPIRCHVEVWGDDATGQITEIRYQNPSSKIAQLKLTNGAGVHQFDIAPGLNKKIATRSLKINLVSTADGLDWDGMLGLKA